GGNWPQGLSFTRIDPLLYHGLKPKAGDAVRQTGFAIMLKPWRGRPKKANFVGDESPQWAAESSKDAVDSASF
ncbi:MAG: hypothetical protein WBB72_03270, partial [Methyloceanibacter sp.]